MVAELLDAALAPTEPVGFCSAGPEEVAYFTGSVGWHLAIDC